MRNALEGWLYSESGFYSLGRFHQQYHSNYMKRNEHENTGYLFLSERRKAGVSPQIKTTVTFQNSNACAGCKPPSQGPCPPSHSGDGSSSHEEVSAGPLHLVQAVTHSLQNSCPAHQAFALLGALLGLALQGGCFLPWRTDEQTAHRTAVLCVLTDVRGHCRVWEVNM